MRIPPKTRFPVGEKNSPTGNIFFPSWALFPAQLGVSLLIALYDTEKRMSCCKIFSGVWQPIRLNEKFLFARLARFASGRREARRANSRGFLNPWYSNVTRTSAVCSPFKTEGKPNFSSVIKHRISAHCVYKAVSLKCKRIYP